MVKIFFFMYQNGSFIIKHRGSNHEDSCFQCVSGSKSKRVKSRTRLVCYVPVHETSLYGLEEHEDTWQEAPLIIIPDRQSKKQ